MTVFIGDTHGKIQQYLALVDRAKLDGKKTFQLGDMGAGFVQLANLEGNDHRFIRGNHDDPEICLKHPNYAGDYGFADKLFWVGGAWSIDWAWRVAAMVEGAKPCWWKDEELSEAQLAKAIDLYAKVTPRVVASHECPGSVARELLESMVVQGSGYHQEKLECRHSRTAKALQTMFNIHEPDLWVFGHYHLDKTIHRGRTKFVCLAELSTYEYSVEREEAAA